MTLQEQLEKVEKDLEKVDSKRNELLKKQKNILAKIKEEEDRQRAEKNQKIVDIICETFGEITEENINRFKEIMQQNNPGSSTPEDIRESAADGETRQGNWTEAHTG